MQAITMPLGFTLSETGQLGELGAEASALMYILTGCLRLLSGELTAGGTGGSQETS